MGNHQIIICLSIVLLLMSTSVVSKLPEFVCQVNEHGGCRFDGVILTKSQPNWQPVANTSDYSSITNVQIQTSIIPVLTNDICRTFPLIKNFWVYSQHVEEIHEDAFDNCTKLEIISIVGNPLTKIPKKLFKNTQRLSTLHIFNNQIQMFEPETFDMLTQLEYLDVSGNNLTQFPPELLQKTQILQKLLAYSNDLSEFDVEKLLEFLPILDYVSINDNEISCVKMVEIVKVLRKRKIYLAPNTSFPSKVRYYTQQKVFKDYICNPDVSWSAAHYRKANELVDDIETEKITEKVKEIEDRLNLIEQKLDEVLHLLLSSPIYSTTTGIPA